MQILASDLAGSLIEFGIPAILGLQVWLVKKVSNHDVTFAELKTVLLGPNGDNGLNGRIGEAEKDIEALQQKEPPPGRRVTERRRVRR